MQFTAIILAGGKSTRMGMDKVLLKINAKTLLERAIELVKPISESIIISSNNPDHEKFGYKIIPDEIKNCGPMGGIFSGLKKSETEWNFIISVDSTFVEPDFIKYLFTEIDESDVVIPSHRKGKEPLIAFFHKKSLSEIEKMLKTGNYKMHNLLNAIDTKYVDASSWVEKYPKLFLNLNRQEDL